MFGNSWHIGRIFGIPLRVHISWFLVFALVAWQGRSYFPYVLPQFPSWEYWTMGIVAALLLFASVLVHELGHCLVALRYRIPIAQITLFIFGGMAQIRREAPTPKGEVLVRNGGAILVVRGRVRFLVVGLVPGRPAEVTAGLEELRNLNLELANLHPLAR